MHNADFIAYKEVQTDVEFVIRDTDRRPINLEGKRVVASLVDYHKHETILECPLEIVSAERGIARLSLKPAMVRDLDLGFHRYTIGYCLDNGNLQLLYVDQYENAHGYFELRPGHRPEPRPTQTCKREDFDLARVNPRDYMWITKNFKGNMWGGSSNGLHTAAVYFDNFTGSMWIEGATSDEMPADDEWFTIVVDGKSQFKFEAERNVRGFNIIANLKWIRFKFVPDADNHGDVTQVLLRN